MHSEQGWGAGVVVRLADVPAVRALRAERDRAEAALEATDALVVVLDREGRVERANAALRTLLGLTEEELAGRDWFEIAVAEADRAAARVRFEQVAAGEEETASALETEIRGRRGNRVLAWRCAAARSATIWL